MKIVVIGAGLIGRERIEAAQYISKKTNGEVSLAAVFDTNAELLAATEKKYQVPTVNSLDAALKLEPDWVLVATPNDVTASVAKQIFQTKAHVLVEKPFGRTLDECEEIIAAKPADSKLCVGFNYRFFAGIEKALHDAKSGKFGDLISVNFILAHGNSPGMEKTWKLSPERCGSVTADLGVHLFDLMLQLGRGAINIEHAQSWSGFWNTGIEEETHMILTDEAGTIFNAQVSLNRWRSTFRLEINGTEGYGVVDCRGRSYGPQSYKTGVRWGWLSGKLQADTEELVVDKDPCVDSFTKETISALGLSKRMGQDSTSTACTHYEAQQVMQLLDQYNRIIKS